MAPFFRDAPARGSVYARKPVRTVVTTGLMGLLGLVGVWLVTSTLLELPRARAVENGPLFAQEMRQANGLMVIVSPQPVLPTFTATIHYQIGSAHEWQGLFGASELLGSLLFDSQPGTRDPAQEVNVLGQLDQVDVGLRRRRLDLQLSPAATAPQIQADISTLETQLKALQQTLASTSFFRIAELLYLERGAIGPTVRVTPTEVQVTVTLPSDQLSFFMGLERMRMLSFSSRGFYGARESLANARALDERLPGTMLLRGLLATTFQVHPFGRFQADANSLRSISRDELEQFYRLMMRPSQTVISLVGGIRADEVRTLAAHYWGDIPKGREPEPLAPVEPLQQGPRRAEVVADAPVEVMLAFPRAVTGLGANSPLLPLLTELLGDPQAGLLTPLHQRGLADRLVAMQYPPAAPLSTVYPDVLIVGAQATGRTSAETLETALRAVLTALATDGPTVQALDGAKGRLRNRLAGDMTDPVRAAPLLARAFATFGEVEVLNRFYGQLETVTPGDIRSLARTLFAESNTNLALLRPEAVRVEGPMLDGHAEAESEHQAAGEEAAAPASAEGEKASTRERPVEAPAETKVEPAAAPAEAAPAEAKPAEAAHGEAARGEAAPAAEPAHGEGGH